MLSSEELLEETEKSEGQQGWLATFADLMSLLMCFFVLLLSFSEMDVIKFKQIAGSMKTAFGVQREVALEEIPKGTSVIKQEFSPAVAAPTILEQVRQQTTETEQQELLRNTDSGDRNQDNTGRDKDARDYARELLSRQLQTLLEDELNQGQFELDHQGQQVIIRINDRQAFSSGSSFVQPAIEPLLRKIALFLKDVPGRVVVSGHTDNIPVNNEMFSDNLALSSARAVAVARVLKREGELQFIQANGLGDSMPIADNQTPEGREANRRVEITLQQGTAKQQSLAIESTGESNG